MDIYANSTNTVSTEDREGIISQLSVKKRELEKFDAMIASALTTEP